MSEGRTVWEDGYATGVQDQMRRAVTLDRVLQDLIAELRDEHWPAGGGYCHCGEGFPCSMGEAADRAEVRLREVSDE
jgi:hypothetical protein